MFSLCACSSPLQGIAGSSLPFLLVEIREETVLGGAPSYLFMFSLLSSPHTPCSASHRGSEALSEICKQLFAPVPFLPGSALT